MSTWHLEIGGVKRSLQALRISAAKLTLTSQVIDELTFTAPVDLVLAADEAVVLWRDDVRRFSGLVTRRRFIGSAAGDRREYVVSGPWWYLENIVYQQPRWVLVDAFDPAKGYTQKPTGMLVLFQGSDGASIAAGVQAKAAIDYAIAKGAPIARTETFDLDAAVPWEKGLDLSCAEIVRRCTRWTRDAVAWWDYSSATPVLHIGRRANLDVVALDLDDGNAVLELSPEPRHDLQPRGVRIIFFKIEVNDAGQQWLNPIVQDAGEVDGGVRNLVSTMQLSGVGDRTEAIPATLAETFFDSIKDLQWQGTIVVNVDGASGTMGPGNILNLAGGDAEWEAMSALVQSVEEDLLTGETRIEFGPPDQLGPQDFLELINFRRGSDSAGTDGGAINDGSPPTPFPPVPPGGSPPAPPSGPPSPGAGGGGGAVVKVTMCDGGTPRDFYFQGTPA